MKPDENETIETPQKNKWVRRIRRGLILYVLVPYLAITLLIVVFQRRLVYQPTVAESLDVETLGLDPETIRNVQLSTPDGETIRGWLFTQKSESSEVSKPLVIYFPGNASNRHDRIHDLRDVTRCGFDVLIFDYRGYGDSTGSPTETSLTNDARLVWNFALGELKYSSSHIVVFGESLGGAVALSMWSKDNPTPPDPAAVVLSSTFVSMAKNAAYHYPMFPFRFLLLDQWNSVDRIGNVTSPITIFHGDKDLIVSIDQGRALAKESSLAHLKEIHGAGHNNIPMHHLNTELIRIRSEMIQQE